MSKLDTKSLHTALRFLLKPVVKFCLTHSLRVQEIYELLREVLVELAKEELARGGYQVSASKVSAITGLQRRDINIDNSLPQLADQQQNLIARVIGQWRNNKKFCTKSGAPRVLTANSKESEFAELVRSVSKDLNPYTLLFELKRVDYIEQRPKGVALCARVYAPRAKIEEGFSMLAKDIHEIISSVESNVSAEIEVPNLHLRTEFDNIPTKFVPELRQWLLREGTKFHEKVAKKLSRFDRDMNPELSDGEDRARLAIVSFSHTDI